MLTKEKILEYFSELNEELRKVGHRGEIGIVGGTVMSLVYNARAATKAVDGIFEPTLEIRKAAKAVAARNKLHEDWLNDGAKGFLESRFKRESVVSFSNLNIWAPEPTYMLAMKCMSARWDSSDRDDVLFLLNMLKIPSPAQVFNIIRSYYPKDHIPAKTQFFIEEVFEEISHKA